MARKKSDMDDDIDIEDEDLDDDDLMKDKGWTFRRKFFVILIAIIVIIAAVFAVVLLDTDVQQVLVLPPSQLADDTGINVEVQALLEGSGSASGEGDLVISHNGVETYSTKINFKSDTAIKEIKYNEFVTDLGEYQITASFKGKSSDPPTVFDLEEDFNFGIVEYLDIKMKLSPDEIELYNKPYLRENDIKVHITADVKVPNTGPPLKNPSAPPRDSTVKLTITHESGNVKTYDHEFVTEFSDQITVNSTTWVFDDFVYYSDGTGPGPGEYTISVEITNNMVKPDSTNYQISLTDLAKEELNLLPIADIGDDISETAARFADSIDIEFDASDSWNDGEITKFLWDFDLEEVEVGSDIYLFQADTETTSPTIIHTFERSSPSATIDTYYIAVQIVGDTEVTLGNEDPATEISSYDDTQVTIFWPLI